MAEWDKVEEKYPREAQNIKRILGVYNYKDRNSVETDRKLRDLLVFQLRETKQILTDLMSIAHKETSSASFLFKKIRDDIDLAIGEIQSLSFWKFPEREDSLEKIIKADVVLLNNMEVLKRLANQMHTQIVSSREDVPSRIENMRKVLNDSRAIFLERAEIVKLRK